MLEEFLESLGFSQEQIKIIQKIYPTSRYTESTLLYNFKNLYHYFRRNGIDHKEFISVIMTTPNIIIDSLETIKIRIEELNSFGFHKLDVFSMIKSYPYLLEISLSKIQNRIDQLMDLSFPKQNVISIFSNCPLLFRMDNSSFRKVFQFFLDYGYSEKDSILILTDAPSLLGESIPSIQKRIQEYREIGFQSVDIIKITSILPELFLHSPTLIRERLEDFYQFGYAEMDVIQIIKKVPMLLKDHYLSQVPSRLEYLSSIGFTDSDIIMMTCNNPYIFFYSNEAIQNKIEAIGNTGFLLEDVLRMMKNFPLLFGYDSHTTLEKIDYYRRIGLEEFLLQNSRILLYPLSLVQSRVRFLEKKEPISNTNCLNLFLEDHSFLKKYGCSREQLLKGDF